MAAKIRRGLLGFVAACAAATLGGCALPGHHEGGSSYSLDKHTYVSRTWEPKTINVVDTRTDEVFWSYELPVGRKLVIWFKTDGNADDPHMPDLIRWGEMPAAARFGEIDQEAPAPPSSARRIDWYLRPVPEMAPSTASAR